MAKVCDLCGKGPVAGRVLSRRGMAKKKGGVGKKITGIAKRRFFPNLQRVLLLVDGARRTLRVCTKCLKAGKAQKAPARPKTPLLQTTP